MSLAAATPASAATRAARQVAGRLLSFFSRELVVGRGEAGLVLARIVLPAQELGGAKRVRAVEGVAR